MAVTDREKEIIERLAQIAHILPKEKKEYFIGFGEGLAAMCIEKQEQKTA